MPYIFARALSLIWHLRHLDELINVHKILIYVHFVYDTDVCLYQVIKLNDLPLKVVATISSFNFHFFPHLLIFLQFRDSNPYNVLNLSTKAVL